MTNPRHWGLMSVAEIKAAAEGGDAETHNELGRLYSLGIRNLPQDYDVANKHFQKAAELGSGGAKWLFASLSELQTGAKSGTPEAQLRLGSCYSSGLLGLPVNQELAVMWWRRVSEAGYPEAQNRLGM